LFHRFRGTGCRGRTAAATAREDGRVVTVTNEKTIETGRSGPELARHLACHGVEVVLEEEDAGGRTICQALEGYASARDLDLFVMGAYGHSRVRLRFSVAPQRAWFLICPCRFCFRADWALPMPLGRSTIDDGERP